MAAYYGLVCQLIHADDRKKAGKIQDLAVLRYTQEEGEEEDASVEPSASALADGRVLADGREIAIGGYE